MYYQPRVETVNYEIPDSIIQLAHSIVFHGKPITAEHRQYSYELSIAIRNIHRDRQDPPAASPPQYQREVDSLLVAINRKPNNLDALAKLAWLLGNSDLFNGNSEKRSHAFKEMHYGWSNNPNDFAQVKYLMFTNWIDIIVDRTKLPKTIKTSDNNHQQALLLLLHALQINPSHVDSLVNLAFLLIDRSQSIKLDGVELPSTLPKSINNNVQASLLLLHALKIKPNHTFALVKLATLLFERKIILVDRTVLPSRIKISDDDQQQAMFLLLHALKLNPNHPDALEKLIFLLLENLFTIPKEIFPHQIQWSDNCYQQIANLLRKALYVCRPEQRNYFIEKLGVLIALCEIPITKDDQRSYYFKDLLEEIWTRNNAWGNFGNRKLPSGEKRSSQSIAASKQGAFRVTNEMVSDVDQASVSRNHERKTSFTK